MVGVGWLVLMDDWLARGGPLGPLSGLLSADSCSSLSATYTANGCRRFPDAAGEAAYTAQVFPPIVASSPDG